MKIIFILLLTILSAQASREMLVVMSEPGNPDYELEFTRQVKIWQKLANDSDIICHTVGLGSNEEKNDLEKLAGIFSDIPKKGDDLWLVWIGHGTYDGRTAYFNLRGKDIEPKQVAKMLQPFERRIVILNLFTASQPFIPILSAKNRIIIGATRSPQQKSYCRFGEYFANALQDDSIADLDLNGSVSLLEASLYATTSTSAFYDDEQRIVQENAVIDDNGDKLATELKIFEGISAKKISQKALSPDGIAARDIYFKSSNPDPLSEEQQKERSKIETNINILREKKKKMAEDDYYQQLEILMRDMAKLYK